MKSTIHISRRALQSNFRAVQQAVGSDVQVLAVVKADAYGHGAALCAPVLAEAGATWFGVSDVAEGAVVRKAVGAAPRILVMCGMESHDALPVLAHDLTMVVWTPAHIAALEKAAQAAGVECKVHLEIDTGMARQGCAGGDELAEVLRELKWSRSVRCEGVMSHLCCAEVHGAEITREQGSRFRVALTQVAEAGVRPAYIHLANSSAVDEKGVVLSVKRLAKELGAALMVRPGLALYGYLLIDKGAPDTSELMRELSPALTWTTRILGVRDVPAGTTVGYGATFVARERMRLALLPIGYADGFRRGASSGIGDGWVVTAGQKARVVGRVSMNLTVVDVTTISDALIGSEVTLLGPGVSAEDHARWNGTIAYEILCGVRGSRVLVE